MSEDIREQTGGIVVRRSEHGPVVLIVTAKGSRKRWVLPKGTVERGETARAGALRETKEEAGVTGRVIGPVGEVQYYARGKRVRVRYFLIEFVRVLDDWGERRRVRWVAVEDAIKHLTFASARRMLLEAHGHITAWANRRPKRAAKKR